MIGALRALFIPKPPAAVEATYIALVAAARNPFFYESLGVPDTIDGRFEMLVLHLFLLEWCLLEGGIAPYASLASSASGLPTGLRAAEASQRPSRAALENFCQFLSEAFFSDMDRSLRELGVADTGVSHRIKKMGKAFHGRLQAYAAALDDPTMLRAALARNAYGTVAEGDVAMLDKMATYVTRMVAHLKATDAATILAGAYIWPAPGELIA